MDEYVGCKVERDYKERSIKLMQPVRLQSFSGEFNLPVGPVPNTPATPSDALVRAKPENCVSDVEEFKYHSGDGKWLYMMRWFQPEILNALQELSCCMLGASVAHVKVMDRTMKFCVGTAIHSLLLKPDCEWDGYPFFKLVITGQSDSDYAMDTDTHKSVSGTSPFLNGSLISMRSNTQKSVTLSVTEAELVASMQCVQVMLFGMHVIKSMGPKV
jgi:hypothetical protein